MEVPYQNTLNERIHDDVPITSFNVILADSSTDDNSFWTLMQNDDKKSKGLFSKGSIADKEYVKESNFEKFKIKLLDRIRSTVRTVLVIFCLDGLAFIQQIFCGLNKLNSITGIMIYCSDSITPDKIK
mgnify:CR=1 FL=1